MQWCLKQCYIRPYYNGTPLYHVQRSGWCRPINMHVFADGHQNINDIFDNHVRSASHIRACRFPLPDGPGQVKLPVGLVDFNRFFLFISYTVKSLI